MDPVTSVDMEETTSSEEELISKKEVLDGSATIAIKEIFPFLINHVSQMYGKKTGTGTPLDMNFLYFHQLNSRKGIEAVEKYTFLHPLLASLSDNGAPTLLAVEPVSQCRSSENTLVEKKAFLMHVLIPEIEKDHASFSDLHSFFESTIRGPSIGDSKLTFGYFLHTLLQCNEKGYLHFTIEKEGQTEVQWAFEFFQKKLYCYKINSLPPVEDLETSTLSQWLSSTTPYFERKCPSFKQFELTDEDIVSIQNDGEVKSLSK